MTQNPAIERIKRELSEEEKKQIIEFLRMMKGWERKLQELLK